MTTDHAHAPVPTIAAVLTELVLQAAAAVGHADVLDDIEPAMPSRGSEHGDYQSNHAFRLGRALKTNPRAVAEAVAAALPPHPAVVSVVVAGPGFMNLRLDPEWVARHLVELGEDPHGGIPQEGAGKSVVIDYSSPNVAKRMHVGHMRSTIIGNALHRMHQQAGWEVIADNHIGDWGTQYGKLIVAWDRVHDADAFASDAIGELERVYVAFKELAAKDPSLEDEARALTARLQGGDPELMELWTRFVDVSLAEFDGVYKRLGVNFDVTLGESFYNAALPGVVEEALAAGVAEASDGAVVVKFSGEGPAESARKGLKDTVLVIRKQDGAFLYGTTDLATLNHRLRTWAPARVVYVTDGRQQLHFKQVFAAWQRIRLAEGHSVASPELEHVWFGTLRLGEGAMSSRGGNIVRLVDYLDEAVRRARAAVDEKNPDLPEEERAAIAEGVGVSAVRYADLSQNPQSDVTFDWDRMLALTGNTAPFLLYSYARCRNIQEKAGVEPGVSEIPVLEHPLERALALAIARYPEVLPVAIATSRPNMLCDYLFELATAFNRFYAEHSVLHAESEEARHSRLQLVELTARCLKRGFDALGLVALERM